MAYNNVSDLSQVGMLENLQQLDLEGNDVDDLVQVQYLGLCVKLQTLTLEGNPVCLRPNATATRVGTFFSNVFNWMQMKNMHSSTSEKRQDLAPNVSFYLIYNNPSVLSNSFPFYLFICIVHDLFIRYPKLATIILPVLLITPYLIPDQRLCLHVNSLMQ